MTFFMDFLTTAENRITGPVSPPVQVRLRQQLNDGSFQSVPTEIVQLQLVSGPGTLLPGTLTGTTNQNTNGSGIATFNSINIPNPGIYRFLAVAPNLAVDALSNAFLISNVLIDTGAYFPFMLRSEASEMNIKPLLTGESLKEATPPLDTIVDRPCKVRDFAPRFFDPDSSTYRFGIEIELLQLDLTSVAPLPPVTLTLPYSNTNIFKTFIDNTMLKIGHFPVWQLNACARSLIVINLTGSPILRGTCVYLINGTTIPGIIPAIGPNKAHGIVACDIPNGIRGKIYLEAMATLPLNGGASPGTIIYRDLGTGVASTTPSADSIGFGLGGPLFNLRWSS